MQILQATNVGQDRHAALLGALRELVCGIVEQAGLEVVELSLRGSSRRRLLRVDIDRAGPQGVGLEDCQRVSQAIGDALETSDLMQGGYVLEVSSPGIDREIRSDDDVRRNTGRRIVVTTSEPIEGRNEFHGVLQGCREGLLVLATDADGVLEIPRDRIKKARQDLTF